MVTKKTFHDKITVVDMPWVKPEPKPKLVYNNVFKHLIKDGKFWLILCFVVLVIVISIVNNVNNNDVIQSNNIQSQPVEHIQKSVQSQTPQTNATNNEEYIATVIAQWFPIMIAIPLIVGLFNLVYKLIKKGGLL